MKKLEIERIADYGQTFGEMMAREYGGLYITGQRDPMTVPDTRIPTLHRGRLASMSVESSLIRPHDPHNLAVLTSPGAVGRAFGLMTRRSFQSGERLVHTAVITDHTQPGELHVMPLLESGTPLDQFKGTDALDHVVVKIGGLIQRAEVGTSEADSSRSVPSELGHSLQGISALTDASTLAAIQRGTHVAHSWNANVLNGNGQVMPPPGPAVALSDRANKMSLFTAQTDQGTIRNGFLPELIITEAVQDYILVDHTNIAVQETKQFDVTPAELAVGMGIVAAGSHLEQSGKTLQSHLMGIIQAI